MTGPSFIDDWFPVDRGTHERQIAALLAQLGPAPRRVLDLGAGGGRIAVPLARAGHAVVAVDTDESALRACREASAGSVAVHAGDFTDPGFAPAGAPFDAVLCLGHTFMLLSDMDRAVAGATNARRLLAPGGFFALDDMCTDAWRDVADGNWQNGVSEDAQWQLVWAEGDSVIALRRGEAVDPDDWRVREHDRRLRVWSRGDLSLLARVCAFAPPDHRAAECLILLTARPDRDSSSPD